ncbi:Carboxylesterase type B protein [Rutstroemia sp. NJR-2017a BBW]|nr:Carboxylesterase type B protein [Rutstroemia sp. NJR-2017a BBW]
MFTLLISILVSAAVAARNGHVPQVHTTSGTVIGHHARNASNVFEFLGIRYAQPTNGSLRFQAPVPFTSEDTYEALKYAPACPFNPAPPLPTFPNKSSNFDHIYATASGGTGLVFSEDCLALNVWTSSLSPKVLKPVLVFIHGGRFASGSTNNTFYEGQYVAATGDAVMVTIELSTSYRLLVFGFPGSPSLPANPALLDQRLALEWVSKNIASFGGDPSRILMYGQSVGGLSVDYHAFAWPENPIASSLMSISGTAFSWAPNTPELSLSFWKQLSSIVGCGNGTDVKCMQDLPFQTILNGIKKVPYAPTKALARPQFQPTIDEKIVFSDYELRAAQGRFAKLPYIVGNNNHESGWYRLAAFASNAILNETQWTDFELQAFTCASAQSATIRLQHNIPVYRYRYFGDWNNTRLYPGSGAYHLSDLVMWHGPGVGEDLSGVPNSERENELSREMMGVLIGFAGRGRVDGWEEYAGGLVNVLGRDDRLGVVGVGKEVFDGECVRFGGNTSLGEGAM